MARLIACLAALSFAASCGVPAASAMSIGFPQIKDAAQDGSGVVWAASRNGDLAALDKDGWRSVPVRDELKGATFLAMHRAPDGEVLMLWEAQPGKLVLTASNRSAPKIRARLAATFREPTLFCDSRGDVWIAGGQQIFRVAAGNESGELAYTISGDFFDRLLISQQDAANPLRAFEDAQKRIWFWSESRFRGGESSMRGLLVREGDRWETVVLDQSPASRFANVTPKNAERVWFAVHQHGLFTVDMRTRRAEPVAEPEKGAFRNTRGVQRIGDATFLVAEANIENHTETVLWRERDGVWTKLTTHIDAQAPYPPERERPSLQTPAGILLGSFGNGVWLLRGDEAQRLDWRARVRLATVDRLFALPPDRYLAIQFSDGASFVGLADEPPRTVEKPRGTTFSAALPPVQDARRHIWTVSRDSRSLAEWNGSEWITHRVPQELNHIGNELVVDSASRVWVLDPKTSIFDPATGRWEVFRDFRAAVQAQIGSGRRFARSKYHQFFSKDDRAVFSDSASGQIDYFDGHSWRQWRRGQIAGVRGHIEAVFFAEDDALTVATSEGMWQFTEETGWSAARRDVQVPEAALHLRRRPEPPAEIKALEAETPVLDEMGIWWFTRYRQLFKAGFGRTVAAVGDNEAHPFVDGRRLDERSTVFTDARGNAVLFAEDIVIIPPKNPPPETVVRLLETREATVLIEVSANPDGAGWWRWRVDGGPWSAPTRERMLAVPMPGNGTYLVEVIAMDEDLQSDVTPARLEVQVDVDWARVVEGDLERLRSGSEDERKAAVEALAQRPQAALPILRRAKESASEAERWWIDAAIQEAERRARR